MDIFESIKKVVEEVLQTAGTEQWTKDTPLLGAIPEFDSMAVVSVITALEEKFDIFVDDDEISADTFETLGTLSAFVEEKL